MTRDRYGLQRGQQAISLLETALLHHPDDVDAWENKARALITLKRFSEGFAALKAAVEKAPKREQSLRWAAALSQDFGELDFAFECWRKVIAINPRNPEYHGNLAQLLFQKGLLEKARAECLEALRLDPRNIAARKLCVECLLGAGRIQETQAWFTQIEALHPPDLDQIRAWYAAACAAAKSR